MRSTGVTYLLAMKYFVSFCILAISNPVSAGIYKWTDENGEVHYSQQRPENGSDSTSVKVDSAPPDTSNAQEQLKQYQKELDTMVEKRDNSEKQQAKDQKQKEIKQKNCDNARNRLKQLNTPASAKLFYKNDKGDMQYMDEKQRTEQKKQAQSRIDKWCQ